MKIFALILITGFLTSCATTRVVKKRRGKSGVIMVKEGMFGDARADAQSLMRENCGHKRPVVIEEGEAVVGASTSGSERKRRRLFSRKKETYATSETRDVTEWRIKYKCKGKSRR